MRNHVKSPIKSEAGRFFIFLTPYDIYIYICLQQHHFECSQVMVGTFGANNFSVAYWTARAWPLSRIPVFAMGCLSAVERMHGGGVGIAGVGGSVAGPNCRWQMAVICCYSYTLIFKLDHSCGPGLSRDLEYHGVILKQLIK